MWVLTCESPHRDRAPRMSDNRKARHNVVSNNEPNCNRDLLARIFSAAERRMRFRWLMHFGIAIGGPESEEVKPPNLEASITQRVAPGISFKAMSNGEGRRERGTVNV